MGESLKFKRSQCVVTPGRTAWPRGASSRKVRERCRSGWRARLTKDVSRDEIASLGGEPDSRRACSWQASRRPRTRRSIAHGVFRTTDRNRGERTNDRAGEGERATLATRADYHRGWVKNRPWRIVVAWIRTGPAITHVFSMFRRSLVQLAPLVEAENENSSGYSHVIKMDTLRRSCCACAPRDRIRGSQHWLHGCSHRSPVSRRPLWPPSSGNVLQHRVKSARLVLAPMHVID